MKSPISSIAARWRRTVLSVSIYSKFLGYNNHLIQMGVNLPYDCVIDRILQSLPPSYKSFEIGKLYVTVSFGSEAIYTPSTHSSFVERAIRTYLHFQYTFSEREPPTHVLRPRYSIPTI